MLNESKLKILGAPDELAYSNVSARATAPSEFSGNHRGGGTPGPIPNPAVKPSIADDTAVFRLWESRSLPRLN